jgi:hypothetical protein
MELVAVQLDITALEHPSVTVVRLQGGVVPTPRIAVLAVNLGLVFAAMRH